MHSIGYTDADTCATNHDSAPLIIRDQVRSLRREANFMLHQAAVHERAGNGKMAMIWRMNAMAKIDRITLLIIRHRGVSIIPQPPVSGGMH